MTLVDKMTKKCTLMQHLLNQYLHSMTFLVDISKGHRLYFFQPWLPTLIVSFFSCIRKQYYAPKYRAKKSNVFFPYFFWFFQLLQSFLVCGLVLSNVLMLRSFNKALQDSETTLQASVVNTASNFIFTVMTVFVTAHIPTLNRLLV